jgi:Gti1/Pac2 family transcription factor
MAPQSVPARASQRATEPNPRSVSLAAAYFSQESIDTLNTVDSIPGIGNVAVPEGWFRSARAGNRGRRAETRGMDPVPGPDGFAPMAGPSSHAMAGASVSVSAGYGYGAPVPYAQGPAPGYSHNGYVAIQPHPGTPGHHPQYNPAAYAPRYPYRDHEMEHGSPQSSPSLSTSSLSSDNTRLGATDAVSPSQSRPRSAMPVSGVSLVPLQDLQQSSGPRRDPTDEELVRRFRMIG